MSQKPSLRNLSKKGPSFEDYNLLFQEITQSSDRSAAIISCAMMDWQLGRLILKALPNITKENTDTLFENSGPLSGLFAKNQLAFAMGLYNHTAFQDINTIRRVRNQFAHSPQPITFTTPEITRECRKLSSLKDPEYSELLIKHGISDGVLSKNRYIVTCMETMSVIQDGHIRFLKNEQRRYRYREKKLENS